MGKILSYGMVGGGPGAFIGEAHRRAINLDGKARLVAGCFSSNFDKTKQMGEELGVASDRLYETPQAMATAEAARADGIDFVVIVTPNHAHYDGCKAFLEAGINVSCDKPLTVTLEQAKDLDRLVKEKDLIFMVTYVYSGHVTARAIAELIREGEIGEIRAIMGEYPQGWLAFPEIEGNKQAEWRTNPELSGRSNCLGDIGTHVENTVYRMTGLKIKKVLAKMDKIVEGRKLDDNATVLIEYENGASGCYWASQVAIGHDNGLRVRIYGSEGSLLWSQEEPEKFQLVKVDGTLIERHRGHDSIASKLAKYVRLPAGHSEGWTSAMANLYTNFIDCVAAKADGTFTKEMIEFPTTEDGVDGLSFVEACLESAENGNVWVDMK